jgi:hypothetical protein
MERHEILEAMSELKLYGMRRQIPGPQGSRQVRLRRHTGR